MKTKIIASVLSELLRKNYDAEMGFKKVAEHADSVLLKNFFINKSKEHYNFSNELKIEIKSYNKNVDETGGLVGAAHLVWIDTKSLFSSNKDESMLEEAVKGESAALNDYMNILEAHDLPSATKALLLKQKNRIQGTLAEIKKFEDLV